MTVLDVIVYVELLIVTATEPVPSVFADNVYPPVTNTAVAVRLPDAEPTDAVLLRELRDAVALISLENVYPPVPVAAIDIESPDAMGITVLDVIVYVEVLIITATEPVPSMSADNVSPPVTNTAVAVKLPGAEADTALLSEFNDAVALTHLENV